MKVTHVAGNVQRGRLPASVGHLVEATDESLYDKAGVINHFAGRHDVVACLNLRSVARQVENSLSFVARQGRMPEQPVEKPAQGVMIGVHVAPLRAGGSIISLSAAGALIVSPR